eukprot:3151677-Prymnesium_polylepis.1
MAAAAARERGGGDRPDPRPGARQAGAEGGARPQDRPGRQDRPRRQGELHKPNYVRVNPPEGGGFLPTH